MRGYAPTSTVALHNFRSLRTSLSLLRVVLGILPTHIILTCFPAWFYMCLTFASKFEGLKNPK